MLSTIKRLLSSRSMLFSAYATRQAEKAYCEGSYSRSANYLTAMRSFVDAIGDIKLSELTPGIAAEYERKLKEKGIAMNTISCYNRTLRAIYNKAAAERLVKDKKPFAEVFTGSMKTAKRSIHEECIRKLRSLDLKGEAALEMTRDIFIFAFYAMGMPFIDIAYLRKSQIDGCMLVYDRHKTGSNVRVPLTADALNIIEKYKDRSSAYVFPILTEIREPQAYKEYCTRLNSYNRSLKILAEAACIATNLTSYTSRHSWASIAYKSDIPLHAISQALGHSRPDTTKIYIRELDDSLMRLHNDKVQLLIK